ncbi:hypothetical protein ACFLSG_03125 [Candidatus Bipolaricaulota bacterium]
MALLGVGILAILGFDENPAQYNLSLSRGIDIEQLHDLIMQPQRHDTWDDRTRFPQLDEAMIVDLFSGRTNEEGFLYDVKIRGWNLGAYSAPDAQEALVIVHDWSQSHAGLANEIWLIAHEETWSLDRKIVESDFVSYDVIDMDGDGTLEILYRSTWGNQGYDHFHAEIVSVEESGTRTLYAYDGHNYGGAGVPDEHGYLSVYHGLKLWDLDGDRILEVIDTEWRSKWGSKGIEDYQRLATEVDVKMLKLTGEQYEPLH